MYLGKNEQEGILVEIKRWKNVDSSLWLYSLCLHEDLKE